MHFLPTVYVTCDICMGKRFMKETLEITYRGKNIYEVLQMTIEEAITELFGPGPLELPGKASPGLYHDALELHLDERQIANIKAHQRAGAEAEASLNAAIPDYVSDLWDGPAHPRTGFPGRASIRADLVIWQGITYKSRFGVLSAETDDVALPDGCYILVKIA